MRRRVGGRGSMWAVALVVGALVCTAAPEPAEAQLDYSSTLIGLGVVGGLVIVVPSLIFTVGDIVSFAENAPFSNGWAVLETIIGVVMIVAGIITVALAATLGGQDEAAVPVGIGIGLLAFGALNLGHAIWSFETIGSDRDGELTPIVAAHRDGFLAGVAGAF